MSSEATVLFCLGATKAGTSWFYRYLADHPDCHMRSVKELHYFDALDQGGGNWQVRQLEKDMATIQAQPLGEGSWVDEQDIKRQQRIADHRDLLTLHNAKTEDGGAYLEYLNAGRSDQTLVADVTPAYGLLSEDRFAKMATIATKVRFLYIIRDPVDRLWSHIRMLATRRVTSAARVQEISERIFWRSVRGRFQTIWDRSDYRETLGKLDRALGSGQLLTVFYEELFSHKTIRRICSFLGIENSAAKLQRRVHPGSMAVMDDNMLAHAQQWLAPQYEYVFERFGYLPAQWQANAQAIKVQGIGT